MCLAPNLIEATAGELSAIDLMCCRRLKKSRAAQRNGSYS
jgi:hypothetical protein